MANISSALYCLNPDIVHAHMYFLKYVMTHVSYHWNGQQYTDQRWQSLPMFWIGNRQLKDRRHPHQQ